MRSLLLGLLPLLAFAPRAAHALAPPRPVVMRISAGYGDMYRDTAWTPVRVTLHNTGSTSISGTVEIPDGLNPGESAGYGGPPPAFTARFQLPVVLPAGEVKHLSLYLPGSDIGGQVEVQFRQGSHLLARAYNEPSTFDNTALVVATLSQNPAATLWPGRVPAGDLTEDVVSLTPATLDAVPQALATFDIIILTNLDSSRLDRAQLSALRAFVRAGGTLVLVGGPDWQETIQPLPAALLPGRLAGAQILPHLEVGGGRELRGQTQVSILNHPRGQVLAAQAGIPLIVRAGLGQGHLLYLAFDPAVAPLRRWARLPAMVSTLLRRANPAAADRAAWPTGFRPPSPFLDPAAATTANLDLAAIPPGALPSLPLFVLLAVLFLLLLGPLHFLLLRRLHRREWAWGTLPLAALLCLGITAAVGNLLGREAVLLHTVGVARLDDPSHTAWLEVALFAPVGGSYLLATAPTSLAAPLPEFYDTGPGRALVGYRVTEGIAPTVTFDAMTLRSMRSIALTTRLPLPGRVSANLELGRAGDLVGHIQNRTSVDLLHPIILAGSRVFRLANLPAGATRPIRIQPAGGQPATLSGAYGKPLLSARLPAFGLSSACCRLASPPTRTLAERLRQAADALPPSALAAPGNLTFAAWTDQPLGDLTVNGVQPRRRDLTLLLTPLAVRFPSGPFSLPPGVLTARLDDDHPQPTQSACCPAGLGTAPLFLGPGGWATFSFAFPAGVSFHRLSLAAEAGGASDLGQVYDWRAHRWAAINLARPASLPRPARFISPAGVLRLKLRASISSGDIILRHGVRSLQVWGTGVRR